ncbi:hypothetical protein LINPERHAP2_LOCUS22614 [Linum perenne]
MAGREVREYTNLTDPKDRKFGKGKDKIDDEDITFQRMVAKCNLVLESVGITGILACPMGLVMPADARSCRRTRWLSSWARHSCSAALDSDDLLYLKEQMEAEEDAERLLRRTEKRAFAEFKISFFRG